MYNCDYDEKTHTYIYRPTGEVVSAECIDEFAQKKLNESIERLARVISATNGSCKSLQNLAGSADLQSGGCPSENNMGQR